MRDEIVGILDELKADLENIGQYIPFTGTVSENEKSPKISLNYTETKEIKAITIDMLKQLVELNRILDNSFEDIYREKVSENARLTDSVAALQSENNHFQVLFGVSN